MIPTDGVYKAEIARLTDEVIELRRENYFVLRQRREAIVLAIGAMAVAFFEMLYIVLGSPFK